MVWDMVHFDVQLRGGSRFAPRPDRRKHGYGRSENVVRGLQTLAAVLSKSALSGRGAHLVTVNDYLARARRRMDGQLYSFLGIPVAALNTTRSRCSPRTIRRWTSPTVRTASSVSITLRDNAWATTREARATVQRGLSRCHCR